MGNDVVEAGFWCHLVGAYYGTDTDDHGYGYLCGDGVPHEEGFIPHDVVAVAVVLIPVESK